MESNDKNKILKRKGSELKNINVTYPEGFEDYNELLNDSFSMDGNATQKEKKVCLNNRSTDSSTMIHIDYNPNSLPDLSSNLKFD